LITSLVFPLPAPLPHIPPPLVADIVIVHPCLDASGFLRPPRGFPSQTCFALFIKRFSANPLPVWVFQAFLLPVFLEKRFLVVLRPSLREFLVFPLFTSRKQAPFPTVTPPQGTSSFTHVQRQLLILPLFSLFLPVDMSPRGGLSAPREGITPRFSKFPHFFPYDAIRCYN